MPKAQPKVHVEQAVTLPKELVLKCLQNLFENISSQPTPSLPVLRLLFNLIDGINRNEGIINARGMYFAINLAIMDFSRLEFANLQVSQNLARLYIPEIINALRAIDDPEAVKFVQEMEKANKDIDKIIDRPRKFIRRLY